MEKNKRHMNKRRKSLYVFEDERTGFLYRKDSSTEPMCKQQELTVNKEEPTCKQQKLTVEEPMCEQQKLTVEKPVHEQQKLTVEEHMHEQQGLTVNKKEENVCEQQELTVNEEKELTQDMYLLKSMFRKFLQKLSRKDTSDWDLVTMIEAPLEPEDEDLFELYKLAITSDEQVPHPLTKGVQEDLSVVEKQIERHQTELKEGSIIMETPTCSSLFVNDDYHKQTDLHVLQQCSHHIDDTYLIEERISAVDTKIKLLKAQTEKDINSLKENVENFHNSHIPLVETAETPRTLTQLFLRTKTTTYNNDISMID